MKKLYILYVKESQAIKVGITTTDVAKRVETLQTGNPFQIRPVIEINGWHRPEEMKIHNYLAAKGRWMHREWFHLLQAEADELERSSMLLGNSLKAVAKHGSRLVGQTAMQTNRSTIHCKKKIKSIEFNLERGNVIRLKNRVQELEKRERFLVDRIEHLLELI